VSIFDIFVIISRRFFVNLNSLTKASEMVFTDEDEAFIKILYQIIG